MANQHQLGVLYTEYSTLLAGAPVASLWSYETCARRADGRLVVRNAAGNREYWLDRSDPLLNTILPGTHVSVIVNFGDDWATGRSLASSALVPRLCVVGPVTCPKVLQLGRRVRAIGAVVSPTLTSDLLGVPPSELVDQIVPLQDLWQYSEAERLLELLINAGIPASLCTLKQALLQRVGSPNPREAIGHSAPGLITLSAGRVSIDRLADRHGLSRQQFTRRFSAAAGLTPKLFARVTRFQVLVRALLSTDVSEWASMSSDVGFYDQAHMINEFRTFAGSPPTTFFRPHDPTIDPAKIHLRGRPSQWLSGAEPRSQND